MSEADSGETGVRGLRVEVIEDPSRWRELARDWDALLSRSAADNVFLTSAWLQSWVECFLGADRRLFVLAFHGQGGLRALAPFCLRRRRVGPWSLRQIEFLGQPEAGSDYLDVFCEPGREQSVARALYGFLFGGARRRWDQLVLAQVPAASRFLLHFEEQLGEAGKHASVGPASFCPTVALRGESDDVAVRLSPRLRKRLRWEWRTLERHGSPEVVSCSPHERPEALGQFFALYERRWGDGAGRLHALIERFAAHGSARSRVLIELLRVNERAIAGLLNFRHRDRQLLYLLAVDREFDPRLSLGNLLIRHSLEAAAKSAVTTYDFLRGAEEYKLRWATDASRTLTLTAYQPRLSAIAGLGARSLRDLVKLAIR